MAIPPPPGPHGIDATARLLAIELRRHRHPQHLRWLLVHLPGIDRRAMGLHLARWVAAGLVEQTPGPAYRWAPDAPRSAFDQLPAGGCTRCCATVPAEHRSERPPT